MRRLTILLAVLAAACDPAIAPKNPYDPATPPELQAKAALRGRLATTLVSSLAGQQVALRRDGVLLSPTTCAADGTFVFSGLTPGQYQVVATPVGFAPLTLSAGLRAGQDLDMGPIDLTPLTGAQGSVVTGRVSLENGAGELSGSLVEAVGAAFTAVTDSNGEFRLTLIPGSYSLQFSHPAFKTYRLDSVVVGAGEQKALPDDVLLYINPAHVIGHVDGEVLGGVPGALSGASISVDGHTGVVITGPSGDFQLDVPAGSYVLRLHKDGYGDVTTPVLNLVGGEDRPVGGFTLARARGGIAGRVALADGGDPGGTVVEVTGEGKATVAAADGRFAIDGLVIGVKEVTARRDGYARAVQGSITVDQDAVADAGTLTLSRQGGAVTLVEPPWVSDPTVHLTLTASSVTHYHASEDATFTDPAKGDVAGTWHAFTTGAPVAFTLSGADGAHVVYVVFSNGGANAGAPVSATVVLDRQAPPAPVLVIGDGSGWTRDPSAIVSLSLSAQDLPAVVGAEASGLSKLEVANGPDLSGGATRVDYNTTLTWPLAAGGEGVKKVSVRVIDRAGNASAVTTATVVFDKTAPGSPALALAGPDAAHPGYTTTPFVTASPSASDLWGGTGNQNLFVKLSNDQGFTGARYQPFTPDLPWVLTGADGLKKVYAQFMDPAGNESLPVEAQITLTSSGPTAPTLAIVEKDTRQNGATNLRSIDLRLGWTGQAVLARVAENPALTGGADVSLAGQVSGYLASGVLQLADVEGLHTLWIRYYDAAGNASELASAAVTYDKTAPAALVPALTPSPWAPGASVVLTAPAGGQDEVQVSGAGVVAPAGWQAAPAGTALTLTLSPGDGAKVVVVSYRDLADNVTTLAANKVDLKVDGTPPSFAAAIPVAGKLADGTPSALVTATPVVTLDLSSASDGTGSGVTEMQLGESATLAGAAWVPYAAAAPFQLSSGDGAKVVYARFRDAVGNVSAYFSGTIALDATAPTSPTLAVVESDGRQNGASNAAAISFTFNAAGTPVRALVADNAAFTAAKTVDLTGKLLPYSAAVPGLALALPEGVKTFYVRYLDAAGNASDVATASVTYDVTAPAATAPALSISGRYTKSVNLTLSVPSAGQDELQVTGTGLSAPVAFTAAPAGTVVPLTLTTGDGDKTFTVTYRDLAGNVTTLPLVTVTLDGTAPTCAAGFAVRGALADGTASASVTTTTAVTLDLAGASDGAGSGLKEMQLSESILFTGASWVPYAAAAPFTLSAGDATKTVYARFRDQLDQASAGCSGSTRLDTAGPTGASVAITETDTRPTNGYTNSPTVQLALSASSEAVRALVSENPSFGAASTAVTLAAGAGTTTFALAGADGVHTVWVKYFDAAGNASNPATAQVVLDRVGPSATAPALSAAYSKTATGLTLTPPSAGQDEVKVTAGPASLPSAGWNAAPAGVPIALTLTGTDGAKVFTVRWRDLADNESADLAVTATLDAVAPAVPASFAVTGTLGDGATSTAFAASTGVTLDLRTGFADATSTISEVMISNRSDLSDAAWQPYVASTQVPWTLLPGDGPPVKTVYVKVRDPAGNAAGPVTGAIDLRATPPSGGSIVVAGGATDTNVAAPTATLSASGATQMLITVSTGGASTVITSGTGGWASYATSYPLAFTTAGAQVVTVRFRNAARVEGGGASAGITFDQTPPAQADVKVVGSRGDGLVESTGTWTAINPVSVTIPGTAGAVIEADVSSMKVYQSSSAVACVEPAGTTWQPYVNTTTLLLTGVDGAKRVCAQLRDRAGNAGTAGARSIALDTTAPTDPSFSDLSTTITNAASVTGHLVVASTDPAPGSAAPTYQCYASPASPKWTDCVPGSGLSFTFTLTKNAPNVVGVRARDDAFNASSGTLVSVLQDAVAPLPPNVTAVETTRDSLSLQWDASPDTDVASYRVYYGNFAGDLSGTGAAQGPSPIAVAAAGTVTQGFNLTGLTTSYPYYVAVEAIDRAGNASGPSGQRFAQPNAVNPRLLSTIGGRPRAVGTRVTAGKGWAYELQNQAVVQLDISAEGGFPAVTGRASLPNFVPDPQAPVVVFDCTHTNRASVVVAGHCVVAAGSTLEGDYRGDGDAYRAPAPVVFFPVNPGGQGVVVGVLPARPHRVATAVVAGKPVLLTVERKALRAWDMTHPGAPRLLAEAKIDVQTVLAAGNYTYGGVNRAIFYAPIRTGLTPNQPPDLFSADLTNVWNGTLVVDDHGWLEDPGGALMGWDWTDIVPIIGDGQFYMAWSDGSTTWVGEWAPGDPTPWDWQPLSTGVVSGNRPLSGVAGNQRLYVFCEQPGAMAPAGPYAYQLLSDGGLTKTGETWDLLSNGMNPALAFFTASGSTDGEHLLVVDDSAGTATLQRFHVSQVNDAITYNPNAFREVDPTLFAESNGFLYATQSDRIYAIDVSNPINPQVAATTISGDAPGFLKPVAHGRYLYVPNTSGSKGSGFYVYRMNGDGSLGAPAHVAVSVISYDELVVRGKYLYLATGPVRVYDVSTPTAPALQATSADLGCHALDVRPGVVSGTTYEAVISCAEWGSGGASQDRFHVLTWNPLGVIGTALPAVTLPFNLGLWNKWFVSVKGTEAVVGNRLGSVVINVTNPAAAALTSTSLAMTGPVLFQGGYYVGLGKTDAASGPDFLVSSTGDTDGTLLFSTCAGAGSLASSNGVYYASCGKNGISIFAAPARGGGTLQKRFDVSSSWAYTSGAALATDGSFSYFSGPSFVSDVGRYYGVDERKNVTASPLGPTWTSGNSASSYTAHWFLWQDGQIFSFEGFGATSPMIRAFTPTDPAGVWPVRGSYTLPFVVGSPGATPTAQPVSDGEVAYVSVAQTVTAPTTWDLVAYDLRYAPALSGAYTYKARVVNPGQQRSLALGRDRLYAGAANSGLIRVYDTSSGGFVTAAGLVLPGSITAVTGLAVQGQWLFATYQSTNVDPYGLMIYRLGANRDFSLATRIVDLPSAVPLSSPTVVGDVLYLGRGLGVATYDLLPLWEEQRPPALLGGTANLGPLPAQTRFIVDGPWAYLVGGTYLGFDLRQ